MMVETPRWYRQLVWSPAIRINDLDTEKIPPGTGIYAFASDGRTLSSKNALYIGKADGARQTLRTRIRAYLRRFSNYPGGRPSKHRGMERLAQYYGTPAGTVYIRWTGVIVARDIEGSLIDLFDPRFNNKDEHRYGFDDDELIPDELLYTWP